MDSHLTATIHGRERDLRDFGGWIEIVEQKVGRTGVEASRAMVPWCTVVRIRRRRVDGRLLLAAMRFVGFLGPLCYQGFPDAESPRN
jgi:hypothetical protein